MSFRQRYVRFCVRATPYLVSFQIGALIAAVVRGNFPAAMIAGASALFGIWAIDSTRRS